MKCKKIFVKAGKTVARTLGPIVMRSIAGYVTGLQGIAISGKMKKEIAMSMAREEMKRLGIEATNAVLGAAVDMSHLALNRLELGTADDIGDGEGEDDEVV